MTAALLVKRKLLRPVKLDLEFGARSAGVAPSYDWDARSGVLPQGFAVTRSGVAYAWVGGVLTAFPTNTARIEDLDYISPALVGRKGLLIEGARTNLLLQSNDWTIAPWTLSSGGLRTQNAGVAPDGTLTAALATFPNQYANLRQGFASAAGVTYTFSCWIKRVSGNTVLDLLTESSATGVSVPVTVTNSWALYSTTFLGAPGGGTINIGLQDRNAAGWGTALVWGAQVEQAAFRSSLIPTVGATATRPAETLIRNVVMQPGYSELLEFTTPGAFSGTLMVERIYDGTTEIQVFILSNGLLRLSATGVTTIDIAYLGPNTRHKLYYRVASGAGGLRCSLNGAPVVSTTGVTMLPAATQELGEKAGASQLFAHVLKSNASPTRWRPPVSDAELVRLSTLDDLDWDARMGVLAPGFALTRSGVGLAWTAGSFNTLSSNVPRIEDLDYISPSLIGRKGLLIQGARTNLVLQSQALATSPWSKEAIGDGVLPTVTNSFSTVAGLPMTRCQFSRVTASSGNRSRLLQAFTTTTQSYAVSIWGMTNDGTTKVLDVSVPGGAVAQVMLGPTLTKATAVIPVTGTVDNVMIGLYSAVTGLAADVLIGQVQVEAAAFSSSLIPTAGATATRNAETCSRAIVLPAGGFAQVIEFVTAPGFSSAADQFIASIYVNAAQNYYHVFRQGTTGDLFVGYLTAGAGSYRDMGALANNTRAKLAVSVTSASCRASLNGGSVLAIPGTVTGWFGAASQSLGTDNSGTGANFGQVLKCNYSPTIWRAPVDDATLQALSTLT